MHRLFPGLDSVPQYICRSCTLSHNGRLGYSSSDVDRDLSGREKKKDVFTSQVDISVSRNFRYDIHASIAVRKINISDVSTRYTYRNIFRYFEISNRDMHISCRNLRCIGFSNCHTRKYMVSKVSRYRDIDLRYKYI